MNMTSYELDPSQSKIKILPDHLIDQIKAGEVVERPSSALKELLENSLDAGSTDVKIHLVENGLELIQIEDNGHGMSYEELPFAFYRHATSKLKKFDDLFDLSSFGFRGEALASIASSAKVSCYSSPSSKDVCGGQIELNGGSISLYLKNSPNLNSGTTISVRDLFYNTPARLKFLNSKTSEKSYLTKLIEAFMLSHPEVNFTLRFDDQDKKIFSSTSLEGRIKELYLKKDFEGQLPHLVQEYQGYKTTLILIPENTLRPGKKRHLVFINNRFIQDPYFFQLCKRYLEQSGLDKNMGFILFIESPKTETDVNVHPNKTKIKIHQLSIISSLLHSLFKKLKPVQESSAALPVKNDISNSSLKSRDLSSSLRKYAEIGSGKSTDFIETDNNQCLHFIFDQKRNLLINFKFFLKKYLVLKYAQSDFPIIPLLISEKLDLGAHEPKSLNRLKTLGFDIELEASEIYLKTIPQFLDLFKTSSIARFVEFCASLKWQSQKDFVSQLENTTEEHFELIPSWNDHYLTLPYQSELDQNLYSKTLTPKDWLALWNS